MMDDSTTTALVDLVLADLVALVHDPVRYTDRYEQLVELLGADLLDARGVAVPAPVCPTCHGSGHGRMLLHRRRGPNEYERCPTCDGSGAYTHQPPPAIDPRIVAVEVVTLGTGARTGGAVPVEEVPHGVEGVARIQPTETLLTGTVVTAHHRFLVSHAPGWERSFGGYAYQPPVPADDWSAVDEDGQHRLDEQGRRRERHHPDASRRWYALHEDDHVLAWAEIEAGLDLLVAVSGGDLDAEMARARAVRGED